MRGASAPTSYEELMADEKTQGSGAATIDAPGTNTVQVTFLPDNKTFEFEHGKLPYQEHGKPESLLDVALNFGFHLEHACGGNCACTTCHVVVKKGKELLSQMEDDEADRLDMAADLQLESRLGCQSVIEKPGEVVVEIPAWNRNYVSEGAGSLIWPNELTWDDAEDLGIALAEKFPEQNPLEVRFTDLHRYVTELPTFVDDPKAVERRQARSHPDGLVRGIPRE